MIDSTLKKKAESDIEFPVLAMANGNGQIVLFTDRKTGTVLNSGSSMGSVGHYETQWVSVTNKSFWRILDPEETVTLRNC